MSLLIVGSIGIDDVKTPVASQKNLLGGSASYASVAASFFAPVRLVGVVGEDFPPGYCALFRKHGMDLEGLKVEKGKTFRWSGEYLLDLNQRKTLSIELNVFERFKPDLPDSYKNTPYVLLGNIAPSLQSHVLGQMTRPKFVMADTMDLWIHTAKPDLRELLRKVDAVCMNDSEARELTGMTNLIKAGHHLLSCGPKYAIIKKGEHGCLLFADGQFFAAPAYPLREISDPTGAGDCFAGALMGFLTSADTVSFQTLRKAVVYGSVLASFNVEAFSLARLQTLDQTDIEERYTAFKVISRFDDSDSRPAGRKEKPKSGRKRPVASR
ncbi:MAG: sugar kinase [Verrucomicrobia bacterium]|nr:sugar kinase [Verrucomicrobiota bacterium]